MTVRLALRRVYTGDRLKDDAQRLAQETAAKVNALPIMGGVLIHAEPGQPDYSGLSFTLGVARSIAHGLGRKAFGFFQIFGPDTPSATVVGLYPTAHPAGVSSDTHVTVTPTNTGTTFIYVF